MSLISMTGYGSARVSEKDLELTIEVKSVNSRFLDLSMRLPQFYSTLEQNLSKIVREKLARGRVEVFIGRKAANDDSFEIRFSEKLYQDLLSLFGKKSKELKLKDEQVSLELFKAALSRKEILEIANSSSELSGSEIKTVEKALHRAVDSLIEMRKAEGAALEVAIISCLDQLEKELEKIKKEAATFSQQALDKVKTRLEKYKGEIDVEPERLAQEVAFLLDRCEISEEIARIESHCQQFKKIIDKNEGGKKIEFLLQEFGREFNTIGSKSQNSNISQAVIEAKALLEKIREQAANVE